MGNALADISKAGVAVWLDDLSRERLQSGSLKKLIESDLLSLQQIPVFFHPQLVNQIYTVPIYLKMLRYQLKRLLHALQLMTLEMLVIFLVEFMRIQIIKMAEFL